MKRIFKNRPRSIAATMIVAFTLLMLIVVFINSWFSFRFTREEVQNNAVDYTTQLIAQVNAELDRYVDYMKDLSDMLSSNASVHTYLSDASIDENQNTAVKERVSQQLRSAINIRKEINSIALITQDGRIVLSGGYSVSVNQYADYKSTDWYRNALQNNGEVYVSSSHVQNIIAGEYRWVVTFSKAILDDSGNTQGVLLMDLNYEIIDDICERIELGNRGYIYLIDGSGDILWHPKQQLIYANLLEEHVDEVYTLKSGRLQLGEGDEQRMYVANNSPSTGWIAVGVVYMDELLQNPSEMMSFYLVVGAISMTLAICLCVLIARAITNPLRKLSETMAAVEEGNFDVQAGVTAHNEVGKLSDSFNHMIRRTKELMDLAVLNEEQKREIEWMALQAQIKPHFLYNTLDSIIWMAHAGKNEEVVDMTVALAALLRSSIGSGSELVPLREELDHVKSYLTIQKMRYNEKLSYTIEADEDTLSCIVPRLLLQPLVENAIYHGIKVKEEGGSIHVAAMREGGKLLITIEDTGVGMTDEQLAHIFEPRSDKKHSTGIGVYNVEERIRIHYGEKYGMKFFCEAGKGTTVLIVLPATNDKGEPPCE